MSYSFDRAFQQRLELVFKKAEYDRMQDQRRANALKQKQEGATNDTAPDAGACPAKNAAPAPKPR